MKVTVFRGFGRIKIGGLKVEGGGRKEIRKRGGIEADGGDGVE